MDTLSQIKLNPNSSQVIPIQVNIEVEDVSSFTNTPIDVVIAIGDTGSLQDNGKLSKQAATYLI